MSFFICWKSDYGCPQPVLADAPPASPGRRSPLSVKFWYNPICRKELFQLFVTELNFWIETNFCKKRPSCLRKRGSGSFPPAGRPKPQRQDRLTNFSSPFQPVLSLRLSPCCSNLALLLEEKRHCLLSSSRKA